MDHEYYPDEENRSLYVGNLDPKCTQELIYSIFNKVARVVRCKMINSPTGKDPYCFVEFESHADAQEAKFRLDQRTVMDKKLKVNWATNNPGMKRGDTNNHYHIFVGDLAENVDNAMLRKTFEPFGEISEVRVVRDPAKNKSKGFGFVSFVKREDAAKAIEEMDTETIGGKQVRTNWASRKNHSVPSKPLNWDEVFHQSSQLNTTVYVGNLPPDVKDYELRQMFSQYGTILETKLFADKGFAFIKFSSHNEATSAIIGTHNQVKMGDINNPFLLRCSWGKETPEMINLQQAAAWQQQQYYSPYMGAYYPQTAAAATQQQPHQQQQQQQFFQYPHQYSMYYQQNAATGYPGAMYAVQNYAAAAPQMTTPNSAAGVQQTQAQSTQPIMGIPTAGGMMAAPQGTTSHAYAMQPAAGYPAQ